ncbi:putative extracellular endoglucanase/cellulase [Aspergillus homomorphus CBS 101889]|uniref:cellulase n=1 Tax=Aspergillus homomorphus (strain CBS 101889) TaxID=1450537 RepID=A0A395HVB3_ASPHC|nr:cellulase-domain-containing protein [Aspergillus homomorphus CBS 101889]RAL11747.1 cellulase-domain-containing protein [Aspergillus homomorphus CBS 101889]
MRISNLVIAASAAGMVNALPKREMKKRASSGFTFFGVSESGAEFGSGVGTLGTTYTWPTTSQIQVLRDAGMNMFRVPFLMERLTPDSITGSFASAYLSDLKTTVEFITKSGAYAVLDPHNYGRYDGSIISSTDFQTWWKNVAAEFADNEKVIFDTNNEYHDMEQSLVLSLNQAAIDGIRAAGATSQYIFVEGNSYSGAWTWTQNNDNLSGLTDTEDKIIYEMHQYLDSDASGTSETCVSSTIGKERLESATQWLQTNKKKGIIGEFAGGVNSVCEEAVEGMLSYMSENTDVWVGASWWSAGPWWGSYMYSLQPSDGPAYSTYLPILEKYFPDGDSAATSAASAVQQTTTAAPHPQVATTSAVSAAAAAPTSSSSSATTFATSTKSKSPCKLHSSTAASASATNAASATTAVVVEQPTTTAPAVVVKQPTTTAPAVVVEQPTTTAAAVAATTPVVIPSAVTSSVVAASGSAGASDPQGAQATNAAGQVKQYYQCGGANWTGPTECESPYTCVKQNDFYYQCVAKN